MNYLSAIFLGLIQGITEFLPVSSSGHLAFLEITFKFNPSNNLLLDVLLHAGTLIAVLVYFRRDVIDMFRELGNIKNMHRSENGRMIIFVIIASVPTAVFGLLAKDMIEGAFNTLGAISMGWIITSVFLFVAGRKILLPAKEMSEIRWTSALLIGAAQSVALFPGVSRSGATIATAIILGWQWKEAFRFSFILSLPAVLGANLLIIIKEGFRGIDAYGLVGLISAFFFGLLSLSILRRFLSAKKLWPFAVYCAVAGIGILFL